MINASLKEKLRYRFDNFIAKGGGSIFISLVVVFAVSLVVVAGLRVIIFFLYPEGAGQFTQALNHVYVTFLQLTDPGNMAQDIPTSPWYKIVAVMAGLTGVILLSMLIAVVTTALDQRIALLKKGLSKVIEEDHTLILGWNEHVIEILRELIMANESEKDACVVILSDSEKEDMDDYLRTHLPDRKTTRIVTRSGNTSSLIDLGIVSIESCKSIIVLGSCGENAAWQKKASSDARVIKSVLAIVAAKDQERHYNIVAEIFHRKNREIAESISPDEVVTLDTQDILAKILVQTSRSSGLAVVYGELLSFDGCEIYFYQSKLRNVKFGVVQYHFPDGVPIGLRHADGTVTINPDRGALIQEGDDIIIIADDDSTIKVNKKPVARPRDLKLKEGRLEARQESTLILGWNHKAVIFTEQLADYVRADSRIDIVFNNPTSDMEKRIESLRQDIGKLDINLLNKDPLLIETLEEMRPFEYDNIIILSQNSETSDSERVDSETIIILLQLRKIFALHPEEVANIKIITEVLDSDNQELIAKAGVNDFIISNRFVSNILAQISEEPDIKVVYDNLFEEDGSEIYLKPVSLYLEQCPAEVTFADLMALAQKRKEICFGVRLGKYADDIHKNFGVVLIPEKNTNYTIQADDSLVVIAEDEL